MIERHGFVDATLRHDRKADGVGKGEVAIAESLEPRTNSLCFEISRTVDDDIWWFSNGLDERQRRLGANAAYGEGLRLRYNKVRRHHAPPALDLRAKLRLEARVVRMLPQKQRVPGAGVDEHLSGHVDGLLQRISFRAVFAVPTSLPRCRSAHDHAPEQRPRRRRLPIRSTRCQ